MFEQVMKPNLPLILRSLGALLTLSLTPACWIEVEDSAEEAGTIPMSVERNADSLEVSWQGDRIHRLSVIQCNAPPSEGSCSCAGTLTWALGASDSERYEQVALQAPFIASPIQYGQRPESDRKGYKALPLEKGKLYLVEVARVGPCDVKPEGCQMYTAVGCQAFTW